MNKGSAPYNLTGVLRQGVKAALPETQKQTQGGCQNETKKYGPNEKENKNPEKELNEMEISNLSDAQFKSLVIMMMLKEIIGYYNTTKTAPGRNKGCTK